VTWRLLKVVGVRALFAFGVVTFLVAGLLAAVDVTSRHALSLYVDDQLARTPWDLVVYDQSGGANPGVAARLGSLEGVQQVEELAFLRAAFSPDVSMLVDGEPFATPWLCVLSASDASLLPPELRNAVAGESAVLALVGPESAMGAAFLSLQGARDFRLAATVGDSTVTLFSTELAAVTRLEAGELNRWFMEQTGSVTMTPAIAAILMTPFREDILRGFDLGARGHLPPDSLTVVRGNSEYLPGEYLPEIAYLARVDRAALVSGWDLGGSLERFRSVRERALEAVGSAAGDVVVDSTVLVLLERMSAVAELIGLLSLLIALPLLSLAWIFQANLAGLLMLNERRTLGLLRLRGVPGRALGRAFLIAVGVGGLVGGSLGIVTGTAAPALIYGRGRMPPGLLTEPRDLLMSLGFLLVSLVMALVVGRRLVRYATTISPLEASRRVASSEQARTDVRFGPLELLATLLGAYTLSSWIWGFSWSSRSTSSLAWAADRALDFAGLPLFVYGVGCLVVSRRRWIRGLLEPVVIPIGGPLGPLAVRHIATKPHRTVLFLLTVAFMASVSLYPTVTAPSFQDRAVRGARVGVGGEWQLTFNAPELGPVGDATRSLGEGLAALRPGTERLTGALEDLPGVSAVLTMPEVILQDLYLPGYGLRGVPLYLIEEPDRYLRFAYSEPALGIGAAYGDIVGALGAGSVAVSPAVGEFWELSPGSVLPLGLDGAMGSVDAPVAGTLAFLAGMPMRSVTDREGLVDARIDFLNTLFRGNAYVVGAAEDAQLARMTALIPRVTVIVRAEDGSAAFRDGMLRALPVPPLEVRSLDEETRRVASDMFVYLARVNLNLYLLGGVLLALVSMLAIALVNYAEDRRTLALMRIRGASSGHVRRFVTALVLAPALLGLTIGACVALVAGYGLASYVWRLRAMESVVGLLPTHLVISPATLGVLVLVLAAVGGAAWGLGRWTFRRTAREMIQEA